MNIQHTLNPLVKQAITYKAQELGKNFDESQLESLVQFQETRKEFVGDVTLVVFPLVKILGLSPEEVGKVLGEYLVKHSPLIVGFNLIKGFLNIEINTQVYLQQFIQITNYEQFTRLKADSPKTIMVEYSSPNTNKPLHLGHLRNNFLGYSVAEILKANGHKVKKVQIINDRGIHICKSMLAWQKFGQGETPQSSGMKGDKLVGKYYVAFDKQYKQEIEDLVGTGMPKEQAEKNAPIMLEAQEMLRKWEEQHLSGKGEVVELWKTMNSWVYEGFDATYKAMGVDFDSLYYESNTYLLGKEEVLRGLEKGVFFTKPDGSVWVDLSAEGLDEKLLLRGDGTAVYMTQDIGTAILRYRDQKDLSQLIYTVGNEQEYHFKVLFLILDKLGYSWAKECYHLSYGMVDLPSGKMKSREGTVVDADELIEEMIQTAADLSKEHGKWEDASKEERENLFNTLGLGALKYYLLKVDPKKRMLFNPQESIDFAGHTGPFIQYTHARICSILKKANVSVSLDLSTLQISDSERRVLKNMLNYPSALSIAGKEYSPAILANYLYELTKDFNHFYQTVPILKEADANSLAFRVKLCALCGHILNKGMKLLGIEVPERM